MRTKASAPRPSGLASAARPPARCRHMYRRVSNEKTRRYHRPPPHWHVDARRKLTELIKLTARFLSRTLGDDHHDRFWTSSSLVLPGWRIAVRDIKEDQFPSAVVETSRRSRDVCLWVPSKTHRNLQEIKTAEIGSYYQESVSCELFRTD